VAATVLIAYAHKKFHDDVSFSDPMPPSLMRADGRRPRSRGHAGAGQLL